MERFIDPALRPRIEAELAAIERQQQVRILLAVESGSRGWGFPSPDSDYDVRFLYLRPIGAYLSVTPPRDVIERPIDQVLDVSGWDLRKALQLLLRSNATLLEWLSSPVRYRDGPEAAALLALALSAASLTTLAAHYLHQVLRSLGAGDDAARPIRLKSYFYALRSALAVTWIDRRRTPPPMDLTSLLAGSTLPGELIRHVDAMIVRKLAVAEDATIDRVGMIDGFIAAALSTPAPDVPPADRDAIPARADAFLAGLLLGGSR